MAATSSHSYEITFTPREQDVLRCLAAGQSHEEILVSLGIVRKITLINYISQIRAKIAEQTGCVYDRDGLALWAKEHGYAQVER